MSPAQPPSALWTAALAGSVRLLRVAVLGLGLCIGLALAGVTDERLIGAPFLSGVGLFAVATALTLTPSFTAFNRVIMTTIPLLDMATICLFDLIPRAEVVGALVVLPALWLGLALGRKGIVVTCVASVVLFVAPGLFTDGTPEEGWTQALSIIMFAGIAAAGMAVSSQLWTTQMWLLEEREAAVRDAARIKDDFMSSVAHELRSPLTSILGYLDLAKDEEQTLSQQMMRFLAAVNRNAARLLLLVTDLLSASATERAPMRLNVESIDLAELALLSIQDASPRASEAGVSLDLDAGSLVAIEADPNRLLQVLDNLLSNAMKFTPRGGHVTVTVRPSLTGAELVVRDTGVGIDADSLAHVGEKFFRARTATSAAIPGLGLGVMITKSIVEAHRGTVTFESREGHGTTVRVALTTNGPVRAVTTPGSLERINAPVLTPSEVWMCSATRTPDQD